MHACTCITGPLTADANQYTPELRQLDSFHPRHYTKLPSSITKINTPLKVAAWEKALQSHPDTAFREYVLCGISGGFRIGFNRTQPLRSSSSNMRSALDNPQVVHEYLEKECSQGHIAGPLPLHALSDVQISPFGVIPKSSQPGKWRLIVNLSAPDGFSVNDGIDGSLTSLTYVKVDDIIEQVLSLGRGSLMAKMDIESAFRIVPVHPDDRPLLGMKWEEQLYIDLTLPFGLRSAPKVFNSIADALEWIVRARGAERTHHYLDDFIVVGAPRSGECAASLEILLETCKELGIPVAQHKCMGPTTYLVFLGILIDTQKMEISLPEQKLARLKEIIVTWRDRKDCTKRELQSLIGHLQHAATVVRPGRRFVRGMLSLLHVAHKSHHHIRLNTSFRADLQWWHTFISAWNGVSILYQLKRQSPDAELFTDASGSWGCAALWERQWFQLQWTLVPSFASASIAPKELLPIVLAAGTWGHLWGGKTILCHSDNEAVVGIVNTGSCKEPHLAHMMRCLFFIEAKLNFIITARHIPGKSNTDADALSRGGHQSFLSSHPQANLLPTPLKPGLIESLTAVAPDWMSPSWIHSFSTSLNGLSPLNTSLL